MRLAKQDWDLSLMEGNNNQDFIIKIMLIELTQGDEFY